MVTGPIEEIQTSGFEVSGWRKVDPGVRVGLALELDPGYNVAVVAWLGFWGVRAEYTWRRT